MKESRKGGLTFFGKPMFLMLLQPILAVFPQHNRIRPGLCESQLHRSIEQVKALQFLDRVYCFFRRLIHYECLALSLDVFLSHDLHDIAEGGEDFTQGVDQFWDLHALVQIADLLIPGQCYMNGET